MVSNAIKDVIDIVYPVGSVYISFNSTSPKTLFGGEWQQLTANCYLRASDSSVINASGSNVRTIQEWNLPRLYGTVGISSGNSGSDGGGYAPFRYVAGDFSFVGNKYEYGKPADGQMSTFPDGSGGYGTVSLTYGSESPTAINIEPVHYDVYMWRRTA